MLVISCRKNESVHIGDGIMLTVVEIRGSKVRLAVAASKEMPAHRAEVGDILYGAPLSAIIDPAWLAWNDGIVLRLARAIAQEGNYGALPILADALEEAGCVDADILSHCRSCGQDVRNSWVVNRILAASSGRISLVNCRTRKPLGSV